MEGGGGTRGEGGLDPGRVPEGLEESFGPRMSVFGRLGESPGASIFHLAHLPCYLSVKTHQREAPRRPQEASRRDFIKFLGSDDAILNKMA